MDPNRTVATALRGRALLADAYLNKSTAFSAAERQALGLGGLLPDRIETLDDQLIRTRLEFDRFHDDLQRHVYLRALQDHNEVLFYRFIRDNLPETIPIVYTPTVGLATQQFSRIYRRPRGLFLSYPQRNRMAEQLEAINGDVDVIVATDGERVLGLGDQGVGGMAISIGKLSLYSVAGGIDPTRTLPIMLDVGTNNEKLLDDPGYLGWCNPRVDDADYSSFMDQFVTTINERFPTVLLQWEDFAQHHATTLLDTYRLRIPSFNDDIQGTAAVVLATIWAAIRSTGAPLAEQRFCIAGAGSAGTGIATVIRDALVAEGVAEPLRRLFLLDSKGLVHDRRGDLKPHQVALAHPFEGVQDWVGVDRPADLATVVAKSESTVLIGVSGQPASFTRPIVDSMLRSTDRPLIMPLSNPTSQAEATPADLLAWTDGRAMVATGSPFEDVVHDGVTHRISQSNNVYVFPGLGLGTISVGARVVSDGMLMAAASAVADDSHHVSPSNGILPALDDVSEVSIRIAAAVARVAVEEGLAPELSPDEIDRRIAANHWSPVYPAVKAVS